MDRRVLAIFSVIGIVMTLVFFMFFRSCGAAGKSNDFVTIYSNLDLKDAANVVTRLKELKIQYEIKDGGTAVAVKKGDAAVARLGLAEENLPLGGVVGWEIFDESKLGATDFDRRIQLIRAISGELARTIRRIDAVEDARVQIVMPETRLFEIARAPVTAAVFLRIRPGKKLGAAQINGIVHLVASSVENLQTNNVIIIDDMGNILSQDIEKQIRVKEQELALTIKEIEKNAEEEEKAVEEKIKAEEPKKEKVPVKIEEPKKPAPTKPEQEEIILSKMDLNKKLEENLSAKAQALVNQFYPPNSIVVEVKAITYPLNTKNATNQELKIKLLNVIVLVDSRLDLTPELKQDTYKTISLAIGYNKQRGDTIIINKVPFVLSRPEPTTLKRKADQLFSQPLENGEKEGLGFNIILLIGSIIGLIIIFFISRFRRKPKITTQVTETKEVARAAPEISSEVQSVRETAEKNPEKVAELLKSWLSEKKKKE